MELQRISNVVTTARTSSPLLAQVRWMLWGTCTCLHMTTACIVHTTKVSTHTRPLLQIIAENP